MRNLGLLSEGSAHDGVTIYLTSNRLVNFLFAFDYVLLRFLTSPGEEATYPAGCSELPPAGTRVREGAGHLLSFYRDCRDFNSGIIDQGCGLNRRPRRLGIGQDVFVYLVHFPELMYVGEINGDANHVLQVETRGLENLLYICQRRSRFRADAARDQLASIVLALLACDVKSVPGHDAIAKRKTLGG